MSSQYKPVVSMKSLLPPSANEESTFRTRGRGLMIGFFSFFVVFMVALTIGISIAAFYSPSLDELIGRLALASVGWFGVVFYLLMLLGCWRHILKLNSQSIGLQGITFLREISTAEVGRILWSNGGKIIIEGAGKRIAVLLRNYEPIEKSELSHSFVNGFFLIFKSVGRVSNLVEVN